MVVFDRVSKSYGNKEVLSDISLRIAPQAICGVMGKNGAGKSTLLNIIHGELGCQGQVMVQGKTAKEYKRDHFDQIFFLDDSPHIYDYLTPLEYVQFVLETKNINYCDKQQMLEELLKILELKNVEKNLIKKFSFGMKRKVKLLSILLAEPKLLLMDEPTLGLDAPSVVVFKRLIAEFAKQGTTVIVASHEPDFLKSICDQIMILHNTKIVYESKNVKTEVVDLNQLYLNIVDSEMEQKINALFERS